MLWMSMSILIVGILIVWGNTRMVGIPMQQQLENLAQDISRELVYQLNEDVWNMDDAAVKAHFVSYPWASLGLVSVEVRTEYEDVLFAKTYTRESDPIFKRTPVVREGKTIGFLDVSLSREGMLAMQRAVGRSGLILIGLATFIILVVCALLLNVVVIRPVKKTVSGLRVIVAGDYEAELPAVGTKEINSINHEINVMAGEISRRQKLLKSAVATREQAERDLRELNEVLEHRIKKRTIQLRRLAKMLASAQGNEQQRIAEGLHDDVAQLLAACRMKIAVAAGYKKSEECTSLMIEVDDLVNQAYERLRLLSFELASSTLYQLGLKESLVKLCSGMNERYDASFEIVGADELENFDETSATVLFKSAREILFNVVKHSGVKAATIELVRTGTDLALVVEDKGRGFDDVDVGAGRGLGLFSIKERLEDIEGDMTIDSKPGSHTRVSLIVPWLEKDAEE
jgi:signal transduction histidine kinase